MPGGSKRWRRGGRLGALAIALFFSWAPQISAATAPPLTNPDFSACDAAARVPDVGIPACTRLLESRPQGAVFAAIYNNRGTGWVAKGRLDFAINDFTLAINLDTRLMVAYANRAAIYFRRREYDSSIADYAELLRLAPNNVGYLCDRGVAFMTKGETDSAIDDLTAALKVDPRSVRALVVRAAAEQSKPDFRSALQDLEEAEKIDPRNPDIYDTRAVIFESTDQLDRAIAEIAKAIGLAPNQLSYTLRRSDLYREKGMLDLALRDANRAIEIDHSTPNPFNNRALIYEEKGDVGRAFADFGHAIAVEPLFSNAYANRGALYRIRGDLDKSLDDLNHAVALAPTSSLYMMMRGVTWRFKGELERALADFDAALKIEPRYIPALEERGMTLEKLGRFVEAQADYLKASTLPTDQHPDLDIKAQDAAKARLQALLPPQDAERLTSVVNDRRIALVIGNSAYENAPFLDNPRRDASAVAETLRNAGFADVKFATDLNKDALNEVLSKFAKESAGADWALVYYAGHGMEFNGVNYLIPIDLKTSRADGITEQMVPLDSVITSVSGARKLKLVLLDACRENPFADRITKANAVGRDVSTKGPKKQETVGLAQINPIGSTMVVFAAKHGEVAMDGGSDQHSPFAAALIKRIGSKGIEISKLFRLVHDDVLDLTQGRQEPYTYGALPGNEDFYFSTQ